MTRKWLRTVACAAVLASTGSRATVGAAQEGAAREAGVEVGFRTGYALPFGMVAEGLADPNMTEMVSGSVPLWFDLGYRVTPNVLVGAYFQYGIGFAGDFLNNACHR